MRIKNWTNWVLRNKSKIVLFLIGFLFTFILRAHNYDRIPLPNHLDEMLYAWSGLSLVQDGVPVSWSTLNYPQRAEVYKGEINFQGGEPRASVTLYKPWLDEPPLFSYLVGYFADRFGAKQMEFVPSSYIRFPVVIISALTSVMVFLLGYLSSGYLIGLLAMLFYGTIPLLVFAERTAMPENLIAFFFTLIILLFFLYKKNKRVVYLLPLPVLIGLAGLSKPTGFFLLPFVLFILFDELKQKLNFRKIGFYLLHIVLATLPFIIIFFWWGMHFDKEIFFRINSIQSARPAGFGSLAFFFITPSYSTTILKDSWFIFGLLAAAYFLFKGEQNSYKKTILLSFVYWLAVVMISSGENDLLAWYRFAAYPFLAIITAWGIKLLFEKSDILAMFLGAGFLLGNSRLLVNVFNSNIDPGLYRIIFTLLMLFPVLYYLFKKIIFFNITRFLLLAIVVVGLYINSLYIYSAYSIECWSKICPMVPSTKLSELRLPFFWRILTIKIK